MKAAFLLSRAWGRETRPHPQDRELLSSHPRPRGATADPQGHLGARSTPAFRSQSMTRSEARIFRPLSTSSRPAR
nr:MAG TPA: hypothetical protein [Caudoviricetes sp.]